MPKYRVAITRWESYVVRYVEASSPEAAEDDASETLFVVSPQTKMNDGVEYVDSGIESIEAIEEENDE